MSDNSNEARIRQEEALGSEKTEFKREVGLFGGISVLAGIMIGSGIFYIGGIVLMRCGMSLGLALLVWIIGGIITLMSGICYAELGAMMPKAGGSYVYLREAYGEKVAFMSGFSNFILGSSGSIAALAVAFSAAIASLMPESAFAGSELMQKGLGIAMVIVLTVINIFGIKLGSTVQNIFMILKMLPIALILICGLIMGTETPDLTMMPQGDVNLPAVIGMMAYGAGIRPVQLIAGPGNAYVTAAKRQVYGAVAIDQVAGPSEICVLADRAGNPKWIAADLLSQAEHGSGLEKSLLVTDSQAFAEEVRAQVLAQLATRGRRAIIERMLANGGMLLAVVPDLDAGVALCNRFAAEHLELQVADAEATLPKITCAGAVFVGYWTPESAGDFVAGPSHVLPTGGAARMFSGLTAETFRRRSSYVEFTQADLAETRRTIETFGRLEGLDGHAYAATARFE